MFTERARECTSESVKLHAFTHTHTQSYKENHFDFLLAS